MLVKIFKICAFVLFVAVQTSVFGDEHGHEQKHVHEHEKHEKTDEHDEHDTHDEHGEEDEHGHAHHHDEGSKAIGAGKAISAVDPKRGFSLSPEATRAIGVRLVPVKGKEFEIPRKALVVWRSNRGVYILREGLYKLFNAEVLKQLPEGYLVRVNDANLGDELAVEGVPLLRVSDLYSTDTSEYGHSH